MSQVHSQALVPVPVAPRGGSSPPSTSHGTPGTPSVPATLPGSGQGARASSAQPGLAKTMGAIEAGVHHAKMEATSAAGMGPVPTPGTMAFNDAQTRHWMAHTQKPDAPTVQKARMLATIAQDQAKAGIGFKGQLKPAEAQRLLAEAERAQASQAVRAQGPLDYVLQTTQNTVDWVTSLFSSEWDVHAMRVMDLTERMGRQLNITKSAALVAMEERGALARNIAIVHLLRVHHAPDVEDVSHHLINNYAHPKKGDRYLEEYVRFENGRQVALDEEDAKARGFPAAQLDSFAEPPESVELFALKARWRDSVLRVWVLLKSVLPPERVQAAQKKEADAPCTKSKVVGTETYIKLIHEFLAHVGGFHPRLNLAIAQMNEWTHASDAADAKSIPGRNIAYWSQIAEALRKSGGANVHAKMGCFHGPDAAIRPESADFIKKHNVKTQPADFRGDEIPVIYVHGPRKP